MTTPRSFTALVFAALAGAGCAAAPAVPVGLRPYQPLRVASPHGHETLAAAARTALADVPDADVGRDPETGGVRAVVTNRDGTREVMVVQVRGSELAVDVRTELSDRGHWKRADAMCDLYHWSREHALAERIFTVAAFARSVAQR